MTQPLSYLAPVMPVLSVLDDQGNVLGDVNCVRCGYNVRGLPSTGNCPECGTKIAVSLRGTFLRFSDPAWVAKLAKGIRMMIWGIAVMILGGIVLGIAGAVLHIGPVLVSASNLVGYALWVWGAWLLTEPDPSGKGEDAYGTSRKIIRVAIALGAFNYLFSLMRTISPINAPIALILTVFGVIFSLVGVVGYFAQLQYLEKLAVRIPDDALSRRAHFLKYALGISYGAMVVMGGIIALMAAMRGPAAMGGAMLVPGCAAGIAAIAALVFGIMFLLMLDRFRKRLGEQAQMAAETWDAAGVQ